MKGAEECISQHFVRGEVETGEQTALRRSGMVSVRAWGWLVCRIFEGLGRLFGKRGF